jgi:hypothetical protein
MKTKVTQYEPSEASPGAVQQQADPPPRRRGPDGGKIAGFVATGIVGLIGLVALAGGGALLWLDSAKTDSQGYYTSSPHHFESEGRALVTNDLDIDSGGADFLFGVDHLADIRLTTTSSDSATPLFVGIGREQDVAQYLRGVELDEVSDIELDPFAVTYTQQRGTAVPVPPVEAGIWAASSTGDGIQTLEWTSEDGDWSVVVMNADGSPGVDANVAAAAKAPFIFRIGLGLVIGGAIIVAMAAAVLVLTIRQGRRGQDVKSMAPATLA